ncbi:MAG: TraR/DksA C4-type zinc finger protein [Vicinamibacterales bacterium]
MTARSRTAQDIPSRRRAELRRLLETRHRQLELSLRDRVGDARSEHAAHLQEGNVDEYEASEMEVQSTIEAALVQLQAEALARVADALRRLDAGLYGRCATCGREIASARLRALPFAVRCRQCQDDFERASPAGPAVDDGDAGRRTATRARALTEPDA